MTQQTFRKHIFCVQAHLVAWSDKRDMNKHIFKDAMPVSVEPNCLHLTF